ncbi:20485_t:CDS:2, partial [Entrophospora sp. SA101]
KCNSNIGQIVVIIKETGESVGGVANGELELAAVSLVAEVGLLSTVVLVGV